ncbi:hypothetical protein ACLB1E_15590 [Escherichia coli]
MNFWVVPSMRYRIFLLFFALLRVFGVGGTSATGVSDWQVTCNNQNFCVARNTGDQDGETGDDPEPQRRGAYRCRFTYSSAAG